MATGTGIASFRADCRLRVIIKVKLINMAPASIAATIPPMAPADKPRLVEELLDDATYQKTFRMDSLTNDGRTGGGGGSS